MAGDEHKNDNGEVTSLWYVTSGLTSKKAGLAGVAAALLVTLTSFIYGTRPQPTETATPAAAIIETRADLKTPMLDATPLRTPQTAAKELTAAAISSRAPPGNLTRAAQTETFDFIVRFQNDIPEMNACLQTFRSDKNMARQMFADWAETQTGLKGMALNKVSYSGEVVLTWTPAIGRPLLRSELNAKLAAIKAMPSVRYADPDFTTQAQGAR